MRVQVMASFKTDFRQDISLEWRARPSARAALERYPRSAVEQRLGDHEPTALLQDRDTRSLEPAASRRGPRRRAHRRRAASGASTRSAVAIASSRRVCESSRTRTAGTIPLCARFSPLGR